MRLGIIGVEKEPENEDSQAEKRVGVESPPPPQGRLAELDTEEYSFNLKEESVFFLLKKLQEAKKKIQKSKR